jgi:hypothetical protein
MKKIRDGHRAQRKFIAALAIWAALVLIVLFIGNMQLSDRIQAASVITLVFITWFYAVQTQALVKEERRALEEEKKKRAAEFGEKKITVLLGPLTAKLKEFNYCTLPFLEETNKKDFIKYLSSAREDLRSIEEFFRSNMHMASDELRVNMIGFLNDTLTTIWRSPNWTENEKKPIKRKRNRN